MVLYLYPIRFVRGGVAVLFQVPKLVCRVVYDSDHQLIYAKESCNAFVGWGFNVVCELYRGRFIYWSAIAAAPVKRSKAKHYCQTTPECLAALSNHILSLFTAQLACDQVA